MGRRFLPLLMGVLPLVVTVVAASACNSISGADELHAGAGENHVGAVPKDGASTGDEGGSSLGEAGAADAAPPPLEDCGSGRVCLPGNDGWTPVTYSYTGGSQTCPADWPTSTEYKTLGDGECKCVCTPTNGSCEGPVAVRTGSGCGMTSATLPAMPGDAGCVNASMTLPAGPRALLVQPASAPTSCNASVESTLEPPTKAVVCSGATPVQSNTCKTGEVCVPRARGGLGATNCIIHDGDVACPFKLPVRIVVGTIATGSRSCSSCSCAADGCKGGSVREFSNANCGAGLARTEPTDGVCNNTIPAVTGASWRYTAGTGCTVSQPSQIVGDAQVTPPRTVCCNTGF